MIPVMCCDTVNRGVKLGNGKLFLHQADTSLVALDAKTGKEVWKVVDGDPKKGQIDDAGPYITNDKVFVGVSGAEFGVRSYVTAYDLETGKKVWRSYSKGPDNEILFDPEKTLAEGKPIGKDSSLKTWAGDQWKIGSGPQVSKLVFDPELKLMYFVVGATPALQPNWAEISEPTTIFARSIDTGEAKWIYQLRDLSAQSNEIKAELTLAERKIDGKPRKILEYSDQFGNSLTFDRDTGELLPRERTIWVNRDK